MSPDTYQSIEIIRYCPECAVDYDLCNRYVASVPTTHIHKPIVLRAHSSKAPADFWKDIVSNSDNDRTCNTCGDLFSSRVDLHAYCASCENCNFCGDCLVARKADFAGHHRASHNRQPVWNYFVFEGVNQAYYHQQMGLAEQEMIRIEQERQKMLLRRDSLSSRQVGGRGGALRRRTPSQEGDIPLLQPKEKSARSFDVDSSHGANVYSVCGSATQTHASANCYAASVWDICA